MSRLPTGRFVNYLTLLFVGSHPSLYVLSGQNLVADVDLVRSSYLLVIALTLSGITFFEWRKWRLRADDDPDYDPTATVQKREKRRLLLLN